MNKEKLQVWLDCFYDMYIQSKDTLFEVLAEKATKKELEYAESKIDDIAEELILDYVNCIWLSDLQDRLEEKIKECRKKKTKRT